MQEPARRGPRIAPPEVCGAAEAPGACHHSTRTVSRIDTRAIFRQLVLNEIRDGRLTASRRRRIIRYAAQMGLTAVETGELIAACREELLESDDPQDNACALRVVMPSPRSTATTLRMIALATAVIIIELIVLNWRR